MKTQHTVQVYVIRCPARGWVFYAPPKTFSAEESTLPEGIWKRLVCRAHRLREEAAQLLHHPPNRFWRAIRRVWLWLERWTHPAEGLLRMLVHADVIEIIHDGELDDDMVRAHWTNWLAARLAVHQRDFWINVVFLPITLVLGLLPGPNIFIAWNILRLYVHWQAQRGARQAHGFAHTIMRRDGRLHVPSQGSAIMYQKHIAEMEQTLHLPELSEFYARWPVTSASDR
ncbi:MAG: hypothetical protein ACUVR8_01075 [Acidobacteriota bacterium]